ncbi:hypothetical protein BTA51_07700 [Hahella sp. CCB-MM4]|uniref:hypothetical protein n=1 Tax=Hahella sp. (strain CCB-MM4) TaxID=1926491 RepID=UPI000B9C41C0|nr:hypothetical protein [Hahella sp. CCB-MM4]OZG73689.1 hypothetical protein BTA51_07700 [Hahella sp. CCB-MM4]
MQRQLKSNLGRVLACSILLAASLTSHAEELKTPVMNQGDRQTVNLPRSGQDMSSVESQFGQPISTKGPVGTPPITVWDYPGYTVYFEGQTVIHAVLKPKN